MDHCDKCGEPIDRLEPCFRINYGFLNDDDSFYADDIYVIVHIDCLSDDEILHQILNSLKRN